MTDAKSSNPRVLIVAHDARAPGGVSNYIRVVRRRLRSRISTTRFANGPRYAESGKVQVLSRMVWDYVRFAGLMVCRPYQVVHVNPSFDMRSLPRELVFVWISRILRPKTRIVLVFHGWDWNAVKAVKTSSFKRTLFLASIRRVDCALLLSETFKTALVDMGIPANKIFPTTTMFEGEPLKLVLDQGAPKSLQTLLFLGRFMPAKGGLQVIQAFSRVAARYPDAKLVMAGDGPQKAALEAEARASGFADRIEFTGYIGGARKMNLLAESGLFVLPTTHPEGMPIAILEAMAAGSVILTTAVGGISDVVIDNQNGTILKGQDADELTDVLLDYLGDTGKIAAIGAHNRNIAWANWEAQIVADSIGDHYLGSVS